MKFYRKDNLEVMSTMDLPYESIDALTQSTVYYVYEDDALEASGIQVIEDEAFLNTYRETLRGKLGTYEVKRQVIGVNLKKADFPNKRSKKKYKVHVLGLGDVGGMMLSALRLIGGSCIDQIGIYDLDDQKIQRWCYELNQIRTMDRGPYPEVIGLTQDTLFDCDVFVFTASSRIPEVGSGVTDVRMFQLEANSKIIGIYAKMAKDQNYKGQFIVVSDPVDLLCRVTLNESQLNPEQIKGFGLGVMHARACYYGNLNEMAYYEERGRAYGPHGKHLIIADDIENYHPEKSLALTEMTVKANLDVRAVGYKPFIAPAFSSAAMSIVAYLEEKYHYSTVYIDGVYFGCKNKVKDLVLVETEKNNLDERLLERLEHTYKELKAFE